VALSAVIFLIARQVAAARAHARTWFWLGLLYTVTFLLLFRYQALWRPALHLLGGVFHANPTHVFLQLYVPLGISFYTFEAISYLVDVRQGRLRPESFPDLLIFILFWPHLVAGPIVRFRELVPQFKTEKRFELSLLLGGLDRLVVGLVQKNLIADPLGRWVDDGFSTHILGAGTTIDSWFLAIAFGLQIYFDFSSYSNMAIGAAKLIGIQLPENFHFPYHAKNPVEFWQRWHMTLSRWIRDYLFFPLNVRFGGAPLPLYLSLLGVMSLVGLWHGAGWGYVLWGALHGFYLVLYRMYESLRTRYAPGGRYSRVLNPVVQLATLVAVMAAWIPFRASSRAEGVDMLQSMFRHFSLQVTLPLNFYLVVMLIAALAFLEPYLRLCLIRIDTWLMQKPVLLAGQRYLFRPALYAAGLLLFMAFDERNTQFIYFQF
jgi:D-alanyl-lipoteichoic acid acyltransferase DltB (MBOAT superfamily)